MGKTTWFWTLIGGGIRATGSVSAVDPRDAISQSLTSNAPDGQLYGVSLGMPLDFIDEAPGNYDDFFEATDGNRYVSVRRSDHPVEHPKTMLELKVLWGLLGDVPVTDGGAEADCIEATFLHFSPGTPRQDIWHWFESQNPQFLVGEAQAGLWRD